MQHGAAEKRLRVVKLQTRVASSALHVAGGRLERVSRTQHTGLFDEAMPWETSTAAHVCTSGLADTVFGTLLAGDRGLLVLVGVG